MMPDPAQLETLLAIVEEGSFDAAAKRLHLTPSAVSQRVRALERDAGQVLVRRASPTTVTPAGERFVRLARELRLLLAESWAEQDTGLGPEGRVTELSVAVNADSLATWFRSILPEVAGWERVALQLHVEDQAYSHELLRRGEVMAAITSEATPVQGCRTTWLGRLRYRPAAAPALLERWTRSGVVDWASMPVVVFNGQDRVQDRVLEAHGAARPPVVHRVPTCAEFVEAIRAGLGWGAVLEAQLAPLQASGRLQPLPGAEPVDVPLHLQRWRLGSALLDRFTAAVEAAAGALR